MDCVLFAWVLQRVRDDACEACKGEFMRVTSHWSSGRGRGRQASAWAAVLACAGGVQSLAQGQLAETARSTLRFEVFDPSVGAWGTTVSVAPAARVEWRAVVSYTGTNTNVHALGGITYQPTFSNVDNTAAGGIDELLPWRNGGSQGNAIAGSTLTVDEGASGSALESYGRVRFAQTSMNSATISTLTTHRHGGDFAMAGAPAGSFIRVAGSFVTAWPRAALPTAADATAANLNAINRGVFSNQVSNISPIPIEPPNTFFLAGTQNLVIFRGAMQLSGLADARTLELSTPAGTLQRFGGVNNADDLRYMSWLVGISDSSSWRVGVDVVGANIVVVPGPGWAGVLMGGCVVGCRRRRRIVGLRVSTDGFAG
jgi:hypothetical protein